MLKPLITFIILVFVNGFASAQQKDSTRTIYKDTLNITGYIYYENGKAAPGVSITSLNRDLIYDHFGVNVTTDSTGYFRLNGAKHNDTLLLQSFSGIIKYPNRGARHMVIIVPNIHVTDLSRNKPITISAVRKTKRITPAFKVSAYKEPTNEVLVNYEQLPEYQGGMNNVYKLVQNNLHYPNQAVKANIEGTVEVRFTVFKNGYTGNFKVLKGIGYGCDEAVVNALKQMKKWSPGRTYGRSLEMDYSISIEFKLTDK